MRASCGACQDGLHKACGGYRGSLETYLCGCYERNAEADPGMHPNTYEGRPVGQQEDDMNRDEAVPPDEAPGFFTVYATIPLAEAEPTGPTYDGRDTYLAWGHHADSEVHAAVRAYWDETGYPTPEMQRLAAAEPCWAVLAHGKDAAEDEGWYFTWDGVTWATPNAFRVTLARTERG